MVQKPANLNLNNPQFSMMRLWMVIGMENFVIFPILIDSQVNEREQIKRTGPWFIEMLYVQRSKTKKNKNTKRELSCTLYCILFHFFFFNIQQNDDEEAKEKQ